MLSYIEFSYDGPMLHRQTFRDAMRSGLESQDFTELLHWLATTLIDVLNLECSISSSEGTSIPTIGLILMLRFLN